MDSEQEREREREREGQTDITDRQTATERQPYVQMNTDSILQRLAQFSHASQQ